MFGLVYKHVYRLKGRLNSRFLMLAMLAKQLNKLFLQVLLILFNAFFCVFIHNDSLIKLSLKFNVIFTSISFSFLNLDKGLNQGYHTLFVCADSLSDWYFLSLPLIELSNINNLQSQIVRQQYITIEMIIGMISLDDCRSDYLKIKVRSF